MWKSYGCHYQVYMWCWFALFTIAMADSSANNVTILEPFKFFEDSVRAWKFAKLSCIPPLLCYIVVQKINGISHKE